VLSKFQLGFHSLHSASLHCHSNLIRICIALASWAGKEQANNRLVPSRYSLFRSRSGRSHATLPVPKLGDGKRCVTPARAAAKETKSLLMSMGKKGREGWILGTGPWGNSEFCFPGPESVSVCLRGQELATLTVSRGASHLKTQFCPVCIARCEHWRPFS